MPRYIAYGFLGILIGAFFGVVALGIYQPTSGTVGFTIFGVIAILCVAITLTIARWTRRKEELQSVAPAEKSDRQIAAHISSIISLCYTILIVISFVVIVQLPQSSFETLTHKAFSPPILIASVIFYLVFSLLSSWFAMQYVKHETILNSAHSASRIARYTFLQLSLPHTAFFCWQDIVAVLTGDLTVFFVGVVVMLPAVFATWYSVRYLVQKQQINLSQIRS